MVNKNLPGCDQTPDDHLVNINVGGLKHSFSSSTLLRFPDTRLCRLLSCDTVEAILQVCDDYDIQEKEFYFDRNPNLFPYVFHFYHTGKLHIMEELCIFSFCQEIEYWGINEFFLDSCCSYLYHDRRLERHHKSWDEESDVSSVDTSVDEISDLNKDIQHFQDMRFGNIRKCLWLTLENPGYSIPSKLFSLVSIIVVLMSVATMCINSIPEYQHSYREVGILLLYLAVGVSVFSGVAYTAEYEEDVGLDTIPACWWWGTVSMTTVGYGDVVPVTVAGKLAASGCILGGTLVVALPITIIFNKFSHFYRKQKALEASVRNNNKKGQEQMKEEGSEGDSQCLEDEEKEMENNGENEGGVVNYSYVHNLLSASSTQYAIN
ncbi:hypothetical protein KOW79_010076 [Hemibagrus wyckioides]|uniref:Delayed-rectifier potassium channel regulatory subunit KCNS1 n=1 Tax=Hemibagrus wyckioides TaxID=337641 RepID=A0A9D3SK63_9TELE|nr:hypothetical protein KOW79_010076 [Hemibagrus wyckioides]